MIQHAKEESLKSSLGFIDRVNLKLASSIINIVLMLIIAVVQIQRIRIAPAHQRTVRSQSILAGGAPPPDYKNFTIILEGFKFLLANPAPGIMVEAKCKQDHGKNDCQNTSHNFR